MIDDKDPRDDLPPPAANEEPAAPPRKGRAPRDRRRTRKGRGGFVTGASIALTLLTVALLAAFTVAHYGVRDYNRPGPLKEQTAVVIPKGSGVRDVAERLSAAKAIDNETAFILGVQFTGNRGKMKAGEYALPAGASMSQIVAMIASGKVVAYTVTIPEGLTSMQIVQRLEQEELLTGTVRNVPPEGTLLPETYEIVRGTTREALLQRMSAAHTKLLADVWARRNPSIPVKTPQELVTLASIVEKETGVASERPRVASVFSNRLQKRMRIQSDPTIIYGLVGGKGTLGRPILKSEILRPTPYNTYTIPALPPGPIANPGRASLEATANPLQTNDLYFVADGTGGHAFAPSYAEHQKNVARWRSLASSTDNDRTAPDAVPQAPAGTAAPAAAPRANPASSKP